MVGLDDSELLSRYARQRDGGAFGEIMRRYAGLVYGTSLRVTGSAADAEDVTQDCFAALAQTPAAVRRSLAGWLHAAARSRSINAIRSATARRGYERQAQPAPANSLLGQWARLSPRIDQAIGELPDPLRELVLDHYLRGESQMSIARRLGVNQATVSRRLENAVELLRDKLGDAELMPAATILAELLAQHGAGDPPPPHLLSRLETIQPTQASAAIRSGRVRRIAATAVVLCTAIGVGLWLWRASGGPAARITRAVATTQPVAPDRGETTMQYIEGSFEKTGYRVRLWKRPAFRVVGYTAVIGPKQDQGAFYEQLRADGRLNALIGASATKPRVLGLGSWDPEVAGKGDYRHTVCIEETDETDFSALEQKYPQYPLYRKDIGASDWLCFEDWKWDKDPYALIRQLGYAFHTRNGDFSIGLHFDVMTPERALAPNADASIPAPELWITVVNPRATSPATQAR